MDTAVLFYLERSIDRCSICGEPGPLTFEHIPPRRCYNHQPIALHTMESFASHHVDRQRFPEGLGRRSLCGSCNNSTGQWYGDAYADFVQRAVSYLRAGAPLGRCSLPFTIRPLEVIKQIATMAVAANNWKVMSDGPVFPLRRAIMNPLSCDQLRGFRIYMYYMLSGDPRLSGLMVPLEVLGIPNPMGFAEVAFPPFGFLVLDDSKACVEVARVLGLCELTHWFERRPQTMTTEWIAPPALAPHGVVLMDYTATSTTPTYRSEQAADRLEARSGRRKRSVKP